VKWFIDAPPLGRQNEFTFMGVEAPDWQGVETQEYLLYFKLSQRSQAGWIGAQNYEFILKPALSASFYRQNPLSALSLLPGRYYSSADRAYSDGPGAQSVPSGQKTETVELNRSRAFFLFFSVLS
jgi:hypothetical protein